MIKKKNLIKLAAASVVFAAFAVWMYIVLLGSYRSYATDNSLNEVTLFARTAPADHAYLDFWIAGIPEVIEGGRVLFLGRDDDFNFFPITGDAMLQAVWDANQDSREFQDALQSVYYLLPYAFSRNLTAAELRATGTAATSMKLYLLPVPDDSGFDIDGAVLMAVPAEGTLIFERLLRNLFILAWLIFTVLLAVPLLSRDPITG